ncbi:MAG: ATP-binding protein [Clostridiales bacterium]|nr:ATP-binding protein [Clostridiales bacterium]
MRKLPLGIQNIKEIRQGDYVYVDKTRYVYELQSRAKCYFLSRPRRFGKSLLLDTIAEAFSGDKELFKGLWIYDSDYAFPKHPVIRLDMSNIANGTPEVLCESLSVELRKQIRDEGLDIDANLPSDLFKNLIEMLYRKYKQTVVVLIDEYDKPILDHILDASMAEANRAVIRGFYGVLKSMDPYLRLTFITGVSKFTKTSIFSEMNNLLDITMLEEYANICGIPVEDLDVYFHDHIEDLRTRDAFRQIENLHDEILAWYDGYSWDGKTRVVNPFGLITFFLQKRFASFWYASGSPKFLLDRIKEKPEIFANLKDYKMIEWAMDVFDVHHIQVEALLFQTGYLTVNKVLPSPGSTGYLLGIPNREVREAFSLHILSELTEKGPNPTQSMYWDLYEALQGGDLGRMLMFMKAFFAGIPYQLHINQEAYYHSLFYAMMNLFGFDMDAEVSTSMGRIDAVLEMIDKVYIFEFKYEHCAPDATAEVKGQLLADTLDKGERQIRDRGYADKFRGGSMEIIQAVFAFLGRDEIEMRVLAE